MSTPSAAPDQPSAPPAQEVVEVVRVRRGGGRPVLGAISGFIFGGFLALDLQQFGIHPFDNLSVIGLPIAGIVAGIVIGVTHPFRR